MTYMYIYIYMYMCIYIHSTSYYVYIILYINNLAEQAYLGKHMYNCEISFKHEWMKYSRHPFERRPT